MTVKQLIAVLERSHSPKAEVEFVLSLGGLDFTTLPTRSTALWTTKPMTLKLRITPKNRRRK